jgi:hypothetical protein
MLLTSDRALAAEVRVLETEEGVDAETLLFQLASAAQYAASAERDYSPADLQGGQGGARGRVCVGGGRLSCFCVHAAS